MAARSLPVTHSSQNSGPIDMCMLLASSWHCYKNIRNVKLTPHTQRRCRIGSKGSFPVAVHARSSELFAASQSIVEQTQPSLAMSSGTEELSYLFRTEIGGLVKVSVVAKGTKYAVGIEVSSLPQSISGHNLILSWSMFRSDSSCLYVPDRKTSGTSESKSEVMRTPFTQTPLRLHSVDLEFNHSEAPFYLSFLLCSSSDVADSSGLRTHRKTNFCVPVGIGRGHPLPLGVSISDNGSTNFSLFSRKAESVVLCLYDGETSQPSLEIELDPYINRTGDIWHVSMRGAGDYANYGYRCKGKGSRFHAQNLLLDPYATMIGNFFPDRDESISTSKCLGCLNRGTTFDWSGDVRPHLPMENLVVYRLNVGQFTSVGTFAGVVEKLQHFLEMGVNAVLLEPIFPFEERKGPYFPYHFFSPMNSYGPAGDCVSAINAMKEMVKALHSHGIEVLLEVVFAHTSEGDALYPPISFRGIDNSSYYIVNGDTLNCNNPVVQQMIIDSLRHWVTEFHIDGFSFLDSSAMVRGPNGDYLHRPPLIESIAFDPLLSGIKIIADCWSPVDMSYEEIRFPHWKRWAEMNSRFCGDTRNFLMGEGSISDLATRICGSGDLFSNARGPAFSFNHVAKDFGLDSDKGPANDEAVLEVGLKRVRNFLFVLFVALGIPVLDMGDEFGDQITHFIVFLTSLRRRRSDVFQRREFWPVECLDWQGSDGSRPRWDDPLSKFLALSLKNENKFLTSSLKNEKDDEESSCSDSNEGDLFISFNAGDLVESVILPELSEGTTWIRLVDTSLSFPGFFCRDDDPDVYMAEGLSAYQVEPHSCTLFEAKKQQLIN